MPVPSSLRIWFIIHFVVDILFAVPLLLAPHWFLSILGFKMITPVLARLVGAALIAIGTTSLLLRNKSEESYIALLTLKILWSISAIIGISLSLNDGPKIIWPILVVFLFFASLWIYYLRRL